MLCYFWQTVLNNEHHVYLWKFLYEWLPSAWRCEMHIICFYTVLTVFRYKVIEILAGGGCALVEWRLETGRTHQIRAHAKYLGIPLLGDDVYGGTKSMCLSLLQSKNPSSYHGQFLELVARLERPCLHALTLGFKHPNTGENVSFSQNPPTDFADILFRLRSIGTQKVL